MIRFGATSGRVHVSGRRGETPVDADVVLAPRDGRRVRLNGETLRSAEQLRAELQTLVFTPDRLGVVKGGPSTRRAYIDRTVGRLFPGRAQLPVEYANALAQRNAALRRVSAGVSSREALAPWTETVAELGAALVQARRETLTFLSPRFEACAEILGLASARLEYEGEPATVADLASRVERDLERGVTSAGPHLHEIRIESGERDLRSYGSQGEQRIAVLALVLAEAEVIAERNAAPPLVLLDDVLSELDEHRRRVLGELLERAGQAVVTTTRAAALPVTPAQMLVVVPGEVRAA